MSEAASIARPEILVKSKTTIAVAMSGGVDSSVAAALLAEQGHDVIGLTMHLWTDEKGREMNLNRSSGCCSINMAQDARDVCDRIGIRHYVLDLSREFHSSVVENFAGEYMRGRTPNPCVRCNSFVKWQTLLEKAKKLGCEYLATGHYARADEFQGRARLRRARHLEKDQSYALWGLLQESLKRTLFPLGELAKDEVRGLARESELVTADKPESQDICFVPDNDYRRFLADNFASELAILQGGEVIGPEGNVLARHGGIANFTIGQRKGLGFSSAQPMYVSRIDPETNRVFVDYDENCVSSRAFATDVNWISIVEPLQAIDCEVKVRYRSDPQRATLNPSNDGVVISFAEPVRAITPGQSAVFYSGDTVLGGGILQVFSEEARHE